ARLMGLFECSPRFEITFEVMLSSSEFRPRLGTVDEHQVNVIQPKRLERAVDAVLGLRVTLAFGGEFGRHEALVARNAAGTQAFAPPALVRVGLRGVNVAIAEFDGIHDDARDLTIRDHPGPETKLRNFHPVREGKGFFEYHADPLLKLSAPPMRRVQP